MKEGFISSKVPIDSRIKDWPRKVAENLNSIERSYIWSWEIIGLPTASEVLHLHTAGANFSILADWGPITLEGVGCYGSLAYSIDTNPTSAATITAYLKRHGLGSYDQIGTWSISTGGVLTGATTGNAQIDVRHRDTLKFLWQVGTDATFNNAVFTVIGRR